MKLGIIHGNNHHFNRVYPSPVGGETCLQRGKKLRPGDVVTFRGKEYRVDHAD